MPDSCSLSDSVGFRPLRGPGLGEPSVHRVAQRLPEAKGVESTSQALGQAGEVTGTGTSGHAFST